MEEGLQVLLLPALPQGLLLGWIPQPQTLTCFALLLQQILVQQAPATPGMYLATVQVLLAKESHPWASAGKEKNHQALYYSAIWGCLTQSNFRLSPGAGILSMSSLQQEHKVVCSIRSACLLIWRKRHCCQCLSLHPFCPGFMEPKALTAEPSPILKTQEGKVKQSWYQLYLLITIRSGTSNTSKDGVKKQTEFFCSVICVIACQSLHTITFCKTL